MSTTIEYKKKLKENERVIAILNTREPLKCFQRCSPPRGIGNVDCLNHTIFVGNHTNCNYAVDTREMTTERPVPEGTG